MYLLGSCLRDPLSDLNSELAKIDIKWPCTDLFVIICGYPFSLLLGVRDNGWWLLIKLQGTVFLSTDGGLGYFHSWGILRDDL
jgi:hypothetical protein